MRLWNINFKFLDNKGLVALWRESLLARNVLQGKTKGYKHHPQLKTFNADTIEVYLFVIYLYCKYNRNMNFDSNKLDSKYLTMYKNKHNLYDWKDSPGILFRMALDSSFNYSILEIPIYKFNLIYEFYHLLNKLKYRDYIQYLYNINYMKYHNKIVMTDLSLLSMTQFDVQSKFSENLNTEIYYESVIQYIIKNIYSYKGCVDITYVNEQIKFLYKNNLIIKDT